MRPGFTQGIWAEGELFPGFNYIAMVGNSLNTLDIKAANIDYRFAVLGHRLVRPQRLRQAVERLRAPRRRRRCASGTAFTYAREDRLSDLAEAGPENNATYISDGKLLFATGALAPDVTISLADYYLWAIDGGIKYKGLAFNVEFYQRWLNKFTADGPLPINSMYDWGFDASLGYFVLPRALETYVRSSLIDGPFATAVGAPSGPLVPVRDARGLAQRRGVGIKNCPYGGTYYMYSVGQTGFLVPAQFLLRF